MKHVGFIIGMIALCFTISCKSTKQSAATKTDVSSSNTTTQTNAVEGLNLGNKAPEIMMATPQGNVITLSSLKGKMVLIDFWASWCGPCRRENPSVVAAYNKYHNSVFKSGKTFEVLSVSLDQNQAAWSAAITKDALSWPYHVSDLQGWNNAAALKYGVNSIPTNFLIDGNGVIVAKKLHGDEIQQILEKQLK